MISSSQQNFSKCDNLCGLIYSVFDDFKGRCNVAQYPNEFFSEENFKKVSEYIITNKELANRIIASEVDSMRIIGCLQFLTSETYPRNKFMFNVCFAIKYPYIPMPKEYSKRPHKYDEFYDHLKRDHNSVVSAESYENLVRQVNKFLYSIEQETGTLYTSSPSQIEDCLKHIYNDIRKRGMSKYTWGSHSTMCLMIGTDQGSTETVKKEQIPVPRLDNLYCVKANDLTTQRLLPYINGESNILTISECAKVDVNVVRSCIQNLKHTGVINTVARCSGDAKYICTPKMVQFASKRAMHKEMVQQIFGDASIHEESDSHVGVVREIIELLSLLSPKVTVNELFNANSSKLDIIRLIQFAETEGLIRRLHGYPLFTPNISRMTAGSRSSESGVSRHYCKSGGSSSTEVAALADATGPPPPGPPPPGSTGRGPHINYTYSNLSKLVGQYNIEELRVGDGFGQEPPPSDFVCIDTLWK